MARAIQSTEFCFFRQQSRTLPLVCVFSVKISLKSTSRTLEPTSDKKMYILFRFFIRCITLLLKSFFTRSVFQDKMEGCSFIQEGSFCWETEATTFNWILGKGSVEGLLAVSCLMGRLLPSHVTLKNKCLSSVSIPKSFVHDTLHSQRLFTFLIFKKTRWNLLLDNHSLLLSLLKLIPANLTEHNKNAVFFPVSPCGW